MFQNINHSLSLFSDLKNYIKGAEEIYRQREIANSKKLAKELFHELLEFNLVLIVLYALVGIWGLTGMHAFAIF